MLHERHGTRWFNFVDEDLLGPPRSSHERAVGLASALDRRGVKVSFGAQLRPATARPETIDTLVEAGLSYVFIGVESDEPADLRRWARREVPGVWSAIERLQTAGVDVGVGTLLFHPDATLDGIERFARRLASHQLLDYRTATNRLDAIPGSAYHRDAVGMGVINPSVVGPQRLPIASPEVEPFHRDLLYVLSPLGPPAMHALCALPPWSARRRLAGDPPAEYTALKSILATTRETVVRAFFALLEAHRRGEARAIGGELRRTCAAAGVDAARALARGGFARSAEQLLEAMRIDAQLEEGEAC